MPSASARRAEKYPATACEEASDQVTIAPPLPSDASIGAKLLGPPVATGAPPTAHKESRAPAPRTCCA